MGDSVRPGRDAAEECMVEFLGGSREEVEAVADCKVAAGPGGVGADFFFFVLEGALGLEDGLLGMVGALARAPRLRLSLVDRGAATGGSIPPEILRLRLQDWKYFLRTAMFETFATTAMFCSAFIRLRSSLATLKPDPSLHVMCCKSNGKPSSSEVLKRHYVLSLPSCVKYYMGGV